eukprot:COSAG04_NODE_4613_length_1989_cov_1.160847_1_plen_262_part_00
MCGRGHPALPPCVPIPPACSRARAPRRAQSGRTGWLLRRPKRAAVAELGRAACAVPAGVHLLAAAGEAGGDGAGAPARRFSRLPPPPPAAQLTACVGCFFLAQPPMYRSIHSGTCPPTGSTFCTTNNAYSCGIYNLGGSTDGAPPPPLRPLARDSRSKPQRLGRSGSVAACSVPVAQAEAEQRDDGRGARDPLGPGRVPPQGRVEDRPARPGQLLVRRSRRPKTSSPRTRSRTSCPVRFSPLLPAPFSALKTSRAPLRQMC